MTKLAKMGIALKLKLASLPKSQCSKCGRKRSYTNPMANCFECKKKFCFDDIWGGLYCKERMGLNDTLRRICDKCKEKFNYKDL